MSTSRTGTANSGSCAGSGFFGFARWWAGGGHWGCLRQQRLSLSASFSRSGRGWGDPNCTRSQYHGSSCTSTPSSTKIRYLSLLNSLASPLMKLRKNQAGQLLTFAILIFFRILINSTLHLLKEALSLSNYYVFGGDMRNKSTSVGGSSILWGACWVPVGCPSVPVGCLLGDVSDGCCFQKLLQLWWSQLHLVYYCLWVELLWTSPSWLLPLFSLIQLLKGGGPTFGNLTVHDMCTHQRGMRLVHSNLIWISFINNHSEGWMQHIQSWFVWIWCLLLSGSWCHEEP